MANLKRIATAAADAVREDARGMYHPDTSRPISEVKGSWGALILVIVLGYLMSR